MQKLSLSTDDKRESSYKPTINNISQNKRRPEGPSLKGSAPNGTVCTINDAIDTMGYKGEMVGHGVRTMFSSSMNEQGFNPDAIERQLAHKEKNVVRAAYNRAEYLPERIQMMQHWADYLDGLRQGAGIVPLHRRKQT